MKKNKAFTLIELIAVITLLALIVLVSVPVIINTIRRAEQKEYEEFQRLVASAAELYLERNKDLYPELNAIGDSIDINANILVNEGYLKNDLKDPIDDNPISKYKVIVVYGQNDIIDYQVTETKIFSDLVTTNGEVTNINDCAYSGKCAKGTKFAIKVNDVEIYNFYVISDDGNSLELIMDKNLGNTSVAWGGVSSYNTSGPVTIINYLDSLTEEKWSNIPKNAYKYSGIGEDKVTKRYDDITRIMRARLLTYEEISILKKENAGKTPDWLYTNLYTSTTTSLAYAYWTSTAHATDVYSAWYVYYNGYINYFSVLRGDGKIGLRPVITIPRSL